MLMDKTKAGNSTCLLITGFFLTSIIPLREASYTVRGRKYKKGTLYINEMTIKIEQLMIVGTIPPAAVQNEHSATDKRTAIIYAGDVK